MAYGIWPQADQDHSLPLAHGIEHGGPGLFLSVSDASLCYAILKMSIHSAVCQSLALPLAVVNERVVGEASVVRVIVQDFYSVLLARSFKCMLSLYRLFAREAPLKEDERVSRMSVDKNSRIPVSLLG